MKKIFFLSTILLFPVLLLLSCSSEEADLAKTEAEAEGIMKEADELWLVGQEIKALHLYKKLAKELPETNAKKKAEDKLLKMGISIDVPLRSWTGKLLIKLESNIVDFRNQEGTFPESHAMKLSKDAWGNQIYFRLFPNKKKYDFIVFSNGPDKMKGTEDDILVIHIKDDYDVKSGRGQLSENTEISLDQLKEMGDEEFSGNSGEEAISLEKLKEVTGGSGSVSESGELELSLEELKNLGGQ